ncbi:motile sperm domain-containing protein 2-like [Brevipalpus obovatus]|uniref:motile sperm domain-containing protein 2-like n=1 Tax=Brevipalpus obovatus TaxID=246614 RepID=UPI003D9F9F1C
MNPIVESIELMQKRYKDDATKISKSVETLRRMAQEECAQYPEKYDSRDVELLDKSTEISMISYLESHGWQIQSAFESLRSHSLWRKQVNLHDLSLSDIPLEIVQTGIFHPFGKDKFGHPLLFIRMSRCGTPKEASHLMVKYFLWSAEQMRSQVLNGSHKFAMIFDCRKPQVNLSLVREILSLYTTYYPLSVAYIAFLDMNFSFKMVYQVIKYFFPKYFRQQMFTIDLDTLKEVIDDDNMPFFIGGKQIGFSEKNLTLCPPLSEYIAENEEPSDLKEKVENFLNKVADL